MAPMVVMLVETVYKAGEVVTELTYDPGGAAVVATEGELMTGTIEELVSVVDDVSIVVLDGDGGRVAYAGPACTGTSRGRLGIGPLTLSASRSAGMSILHDAISTSGVMSNTGHSEVIPSAPISPGCVSGPQRLVAAARTPSSHATMMSPW